MKIQKVFEAKTKEEARQYAIDWQNWMSDQNLCYMNLAEWGGALNKLAVKFDLVEEFKENSII